MRSCWVIQNRRGKSRELESWIKFYFSLNRCAAKMARNGLGTVDLVEISDILQTQDDSRRTIADSPMHQLQGQLLLLLSKAILKIPYGDL